MFKKFEIIILFLLTANLISAQNIKELVNSFLNETNKNKKIELLGGITMKYCDISLDTAILYSDTLLMLTSKSKDLSKQSRAHAIGAFVNERKGNFEKGLELQLRALKLSKQTKDEPLIANNYNGVGVMYDYLGNYDKAIFFYKKGLSLREKIKDKIGMQGSLGNLGLAYHLKGDFKNALLYLYESKKLSETNKDTAGYTSADINLALIFQQQKNFKKALELYQEALKLYQIKNWQYDMALAYNNIGSVYLDMNELEKGMSYHKKSLKIKSDIGDLPGMVMSYHNIAITLNKLGNLDSALFYLKKGEIILDKVPDAASKIELYNSMGMIYNKIGNYKEAKLYLEAAEKIYNDGNQYYKIYEVYNSIAELNYNLKNYEKAYDYNLLYWEMMDSIQNNENSRILQQKELDEKYERKILKEKLIKEQEDEKREIEKNAEDKTQRIKNYIYITLLISFFIIIIIVYRSFTEKKKANNLLSERNNVISKQNNEIKKQSILLEEKNRDITDSIQYAKRLQNSILPEDSELNKVLIDYFIFFQPKDIVSGDFYWLHDLSSNELNKFLFAVVDCTGHGVPGGFVSLVGNNALHRAVNEFKLTKTSLILDKVSSLVESDFERENEEIRDGMDMALIAITKDKNKILLEYSGANNPIWIFNKERKSWKVNGNDFLSEYFLELKADKQPIGRYEHRKQFSSNEIELIKGDTLYLFTDGYADQFGGPRGKKYKYSQLFEKLKSIQHLPLTRQNEILIEEIENWKSWKLEDGSKNEIEQVDDICIVGIKI